MDEQVTSLRGPVEKIDGKLQLRIPLDAGGRELAESAKGISELTAECLIVFIPEFIAGVIRVQEGDFVDVDNRNGKFNIRPVKARPVQ